MFSRKIWIAICMFEIILYLLLLVFISRTSKSIDKVDYEGIRFNYKGVNIIINILVALTYFVFICKLFTKEERGDKYAKYRGIRYVKMSLLLVLFAFNLQMQSTIKNAKNILFQ